MYGIPGLDRALLPAAVLRRTAAAVPGITLISGTACIRLLSLVRRLKRIYGCL